MSKNSQSSNPCARRWCITDNTVTETTDPEKWSEHFDENVKYAVWQLEKAATGKLHIQAYLKFVKPVRISGVQKLLPGVHCEMAKGTDEQCIKYCSKEDSKVSGPFFHGECDSQGKRRDLDELADLLHAGKTTDEIAEEQTASYIRYHKGIQAAHQALQRKKTKTFREVTVTVYWGETGTGKTRRCHDQASDLFAPDIGANSLWWDGYMGEDAILFDDFYGQIKISHMLRLLDGYNLAIPIKGGYTSANWTRVYITSNVHPDEWYKSESIPESVRAAFRRRISNIIPVSGYRTPSPMMDSPDEAQIVDEIIARMQ